ncbi:hypothetical protein PG990_002708 [Apiospora arundinis]
MDKDALILKDQVWQPLGKDLFNGDPISELDHAAFTDYYTKQWHIMARHGSGSRYPVSMRCRDISKLIRQIQCNKTRAEIVAELKTDQSVNTLLQTEQDYENLLNLALRLASMMKFGAVRRQIMPRRFLEWEQGSFPDFLAKHFGKPPVLSHDRVRLPKAFHAWNIEKIGGSASVSPTTWPITCCWSKMTRSFSSSTTSPSWSTIMNGLVDETLRTLALLLPEAQFGRRSRGAGRKWLRQTRLREADGRVLDMRLAHCGNLQMEERQIEHFTYWRDRLVILRQAYDDATPRTIAQWWHDRRNGVQWYTFWVAILVLVLTAFLGLVQCVESALQVYKAYVPS